MTVPGEGRPRPSCLLGLWTLLSVCVCGCVIVMIVIIVTAEVVGVPVCFRCAVKLLGRLTSLPADVA
jgi:hypothetical protein